MKQLVAALKGIILTFLVKIKKLVFYEGTEFVFSFFNTFLKKLS